MPRSTRIDLVEAVRLHDLLPILCSLHVAADWDQLGPMLALARDFQDALKALVSVQTPAFGELCPRETGWTSHCSGLRALALARC